MNTTLDDVLPFLLRKDEIAHLQDDSLFIGDRRSYPWRKEYVRCTSISEACAALTQMVTQGGGPLQVALCAMRWTASRMRRALVPATPEYLLSVIHALSASRPTNTTMARTLTAIYSEVQPSFGKKPTAIADAIEASVEAHEQQFDAVYEAMGYLGASLIHDGDTILTTCFAEHSLVLSLLAAREAGKHVQVLVSETRPYLQGSRLTAPTLQELGFDVRLICDGMGAHYIADGTVDLYMTAADMVCADGSVVNKVGTLANAVCAHEFDIPYYAFSMAPDLSRKSGSDVVMEERDGREVCEALGHSTTSGGMQALYPAFDVIDPRFVSAIVTGCGVFTPQALRRGYTGGAI